MNRKKVIFLSLSKVTPSNIKSNGIYTSLLRKLHENNFDVYILNPIEKRLYNNQDEFLNEVDGLKYLNVRIGNITKTNKIEKGISTVNIEKKYLKAIKKHLSEVKFDLILYPTPPITFYKVIKYLKRRDGALTYLMLKDIFPQNAVDIGFFSKRGPIYKYFRNKEKNLYEISDYIGCMSQANVDYLLEHNDLDSKKVEIFSNSIEPLDLSISQLEIDNTRQEYNLPINKKIFIYGGNLGKPQGLPFLIKCIESVKNIDELLFLIVGNGTEFEYIIKMKDELNLYNLRIMERLQKEDFEKLVASSDVGMISLDHRFTIPNYPSRVLSYMQAKLPVLAITDKNTDIGRNIEDNNIGRRCKDNSLDEFYDIINKILTDFKKHNISEKKRNSFNYLKDKFNIRKSILNITNKI